jgi:succinate dehydrogenase / fumarate reductase cytochrome b subunit
MGITWGVWISPAAQKRALNVCTIFGVLLAVVGLSALFGMRQYGTGEKLNEARQVEDQMYEAKVKAGELEENEHKRAEALEKVEEETKEVARSAKE